MTRAPIPNNEKHQQRKGELSAYNYYNSHLTPNSLWNRWLIDFRHYLRRHLAKRPKLYKPILKYRYDHELTDINYDLLIEGYPRSGNSYLVEMLRLGARDLRILSHRHNPAYVLLALQHGRRVVVLIRNPIDAVASWVIYAKTDIYDALRYYTEYYRLIIPAIDQLLTINFNSLVGNPISVIRRIDQRYKIGIDFEALQERDRCEGIVRARIQSRGWGEGPDQVSLPHSERSEKQEFVQRQLLRPRFAKLLSAAEEIYARMYNPGDR